MPGTFSKQTIRDIDLSGKTVLLRADYNVPLEDGRITDDYRITQSLPTVRELLKHNVRLIICSHQGRPKGPEDKAHSLAPVASRLGELLGQEVGFASDCVGEPAEQAVAALGAGGVLVLENLRFHPEEEANDDGFARRLAALADIFVQDGFGVVHRAHASTEAITHHLPSVAGLLLEKEVNTITAAMENPKRPLTAIVGGAKIADKLDVLNRFMEIADMVAIGGAMANTFLKAQGVDVGGSLYDKDGLDTAKDIMEKAAAEAAKRSFTFKIPQDGVVAAALETTAPTQVVGWDTPVKDDEKILDIGPKSAATIAELIDKSQTVVWNGAMGVTEVAGADGGPGPFAGGTERVIKALIGEDGHKPETIVGGGDTVGYIESRGLVDSFYHVSTGGGASLELMSGHALPGVEALLDKK